MRNNIKIQMREDNQVGSIYIDGFEIGKINKQKLQSGNSLVKHLYHVEYRYQDMDPEYKFVSRNYYRYFHTLTNIYDFFANSSIEELTKKVDNFDLLAYGKK